MRVVTSDLREAIAAVSGVYCPHDVKVLESNRGIDAVLEAHPGSRQQIVSLRYSAPVKIDAGQFENLLLFMTDRRRPPKAGITSIGRRVKRSRCRRTCQAS